MLTITQKRDENCWVVHGTALAYKGRGVLLLGASGVGKSNLALQCIGRGGRLIADDQVVLENKQDQIWLSCPPILQHTLEIYGIGPLSCDSVTDSVALDLICHLIPEKPQRFPEPMQIPLWHHSLPCLVLDPCWPTTVDKLLLFIRSLSGNMRSK